MDDRYLLTIGKLADYAGVTIKAVRHYHERGLLPEPVRDASGYRRYGAHHAIALIKIKTLADAGVPLARVKELLQSDADEFRAAITEIDRALKDRAAEIRRTRERIAQLEAGDRLFVPPECDEFLRRLRELGVSERGVRQERDLWILLHAASPKDAEGWVAEKHAALDDPAFRALYVDYDAAFDWDPGDPRLPALAERTRRWAEGRSPESAEHTDAAGQTERVGTIARLAAATAEVTSPAWTRLAELTR